MEVRWRAGLESADPLMRATAARLLGLEGTPGSAAVLRRALATETDPHARGELARALIVLGEPADDGACWRPCVAWIQSRGAAR